MNVLICNICLKKGVEFGIVGLVSMMNMCIVNNMILIIFIGLFVKNIVD